MLNKFHVAHHWYCQVSIRKQKWPLSPRFTSMRKSYPNIDIQLPSHKSKAGRKLFHFTTHCEKCFDRLYWHLVADHNIWQNVLLTNYLTLCFQPMEELYSGPGRFEEMDSILFDDGANPDCTLRVCGLQKLKVCVSWWLCRWWWWTQNT